MGKVHERIENAQIGTIPTSWRREINQEKNNNPNTPEYTAQTIDKMFRDFWKRFTPKQLAIFIQTFSLISIFFEGYDQGRFHYTLMPSFFVCVCPN
jgi:hypothetical protein